MHKNNMFSILRNENVTRGIDDRFVVKRLCVYKMAEHIEIYFGTQKLF